MFAVNLYTIDRSHFFSLVRSVVVKTGIGSGRCLFLGTDTNHWSGTNGRPVVGAVTVGWEGSMVSMVVGTGVFRHVRRRWTRGVARSVLGTDGLPEDVILPSTLCGAGLATL